MSVTFAIQTEEQKKVLGVSIFFSILVVVTICLRLLAHRIAQRKWRLSDYFIIAAGVFAVALQSLIIVGVVYSGIGFARLAVITETYGAEPITILMKLSIPLELSWALSLSCTKISILLLYINVFPVSWVVRIVWATIVLIVAWTVGTILTDFLMCRPFAYRWDHTIPGGSCGNQAISFTVTGVINLVTNVIVLVIPMPLLYKLQIARYKKTMLIFIFGLAPGICVINILRIFMITTMDFADVTYSNPLTVILSGFEICLAVILASIPLLRPLLGRSSFSSEATARTSIKFSLPSRRSKVPVDDQLLQLQDNSSQLVLQPIGPTHDASVVVQKPPEAREPPHITDNSTSREETGVQDLQQRTGWEAISVQQGWAVSHRQK